MANELKITKAQKEAIYTENSDIIVSAAAGSGKTFVLVSRIVRLIKEKNADLDRMLIVTFTNSAASDMKKKLIKALELEKLQTNNSNIRRQLRKIANANISTMHAYSIRLIRKYFEYLAIDPAFKIAKSAEISVLREKAMKVCLDKEYMELDKDFSDLIEFYFPNNIDGVEDLVYRIYDKIQAQINPIEWMDYYSNINDTDIIIDHISKEIKEGIRSSKEILDLALDICNLEDGPINYAEALESDISYLETIDFTDYDKMLKDLRKVSFIRLPGKSKKDQNIDSLKKEEVKELRKDVKEIIKSLVETYSSKTRQRLEFEYSLANKYLKVVARLVRNFTYNFQALKKDNSLLDFSDIEHYMLKILENKEIRKEVVNSLDYVFFDEYQDASPIQEEILKKLKKPDNLFVVGDIKQSIYKFRNAEPELFLNRYFSYKEDISKGTAIDLDMNFRSSGLVLNFINFIFSSIMTKKNGGVNYNSEGQRLVPREEVLKDSNDRSDVKIVINQDYISNNPDDINQNAIYIANEILNLVENKGYKYSDIAILMRSVRHRTDDYEKALKELAIPYYLDNIDISLESPEVDIFISYLKLINNTRDDFALISTILTPLGDFNEDELALIRDENPESSFYNAFISYKEEGPIKEKIQAFVTKIQDYRMKLRQMTLADFSSFLLYDSGYADYIKCGYLGKAKLENIKALLQRIEEYEDLSSNGLAGFLIYVEKLLKAPGNTLEPTKLSSEEDNVVRIMTIHKSKGLEMKVVFVTELERNFENLDARDNFMLESGLGFGLKLVDSQLATSFKSAKKSMIELKTYKDLKDEETRLLYVATTRAINHLYLVGKVKDLDKYLNRVSKFEKSYAVKKANSLLDFVMIPTVRDMFFKTYLDNYLDLDVSRLSSYFSKDKLNNYSLLFNDYLTFESIKNPERSIIDMDKSYTKIEKDKKFVYPYLNATRQAYKRTVSQISKENLQKTDDTLDFFEYREIYNSENSFSLDKKPNILHLNSFSKADFGTIFHTLMRHIKIKEHDVKSVNDEIERLISMEILTREEASLIDPNMIVTFFKTKLAGKFIQNKNSLKREEAFTMVYVNENGEKIYLDGQLDAYFIENGEINIVDYKTDSRIDKLKYETQVKLYANALRKAYGLKIKAIYLYWARFGQVTKLDNLDL